MYWSGIWMVAGIGAALLVALVVASGVLLGAWFGTKAVLQRRSEAAGGVRRAPAPAGSASTATATLARPTAAPRPRTRAA